VDEADKLQEPLNLEFIFWCWQAVLIPEVGEFQLRGCMRHTPIIIYKSVTWDVTESQKAIHCSYVCYSLAINCCTIKIATDTHITQNMVLIKTMVMSMVTKWKGSWHMWIILPYFI